MSKIVSNTNLALFKANCDNLYATQADVTEEAAARLQGDNTLQEQVNARYAKPSTGIPEEDLSASAQNSLDKANSAYQKPTSGIPESDLSQDLQNKIAKIEGFGGVYTPKGSIAYASLPATPSESVSGFVWNILDSFTTDSRFVEGAGKLISAGANVACILDGSNYKYDILSGFTDLSSYATKTYVTDVVSSEASARMSADTNLQSNIDAKYTKPATGIPSTDLATSIQTSLSKANSAYQKPSGGIPESDLASDVQEKLSIEYMSDAEVNALFS